MINLIPDEEVAVIRDSARLDDLGEPIDSRPSREAVRCVVCPGPTSDLGAARPNGARIAYTLHFPKTYEGRPPRLLGRGARRGVRRGRRPDAHDRGGDARRMEHGRRGGEGGWVGSRRTARDTPRS